MILLLAAQLMQPEALPPAMEPMVNEYSQCAFSAIDRLRTDRRKKQKTQRVTEAMKACAEVRAAAIGKADLALSAEAGFADRAYRLAFIANRFDGLDIMIRDTALGRLDPDNWK